MEGMELLTSEEVAEWMRVAPSTLCRWRQTGRGPRVIWLSPSCPRYRRSDVETWLERVAS
jgi:predicted DNA-binding transcriptional regulator AlpA